MSFSVTTHHLRNIGLHNYQMDDKLKFYNFVLVLASDCILFVDDFNVHKTPSSNGRKFYISNPSSTPSNSSADDRSKGASRNPIAKRMWLLAKADAKTRYSSFEYTMETAYNKANWSMKVICYIWTLL